MKHFTLKRIILYGISLLFIALLITCAVIYSRLGGSLTSQRAAERWTGQGEGRFSQITRLYPRGMEPLESSLLSLGTAIDSSLTQGSLEAEDGGRLWAYCYSALGEVSITTGSGAASTAAFGVGGDFFLFHPYNLRAGSYFTGADLNSDLIVIDVTTAWKLFGSVNVAGREVLVGSSGLGYTLCIISGVVELESDKASTLALSDGSYIFMSYSLLSKYSDAGINCVEAVLPDPVPGFAMETAGNAFPASDVTIENSGRFNISKISRILTGFGERSIQNSGIVYPYWENAARVVEDRLALILVLAAICTLFPLAMAVWLFILLRRHVRNNRKEIKALIVRLFERAAGFIRKRADKSRRVKARRSNRA